MVNRWENPILADDVPRPKPAGARCDASHLGRSTPGTGAGTASAQIFFCGLFKAPSDSLIMFNIERLKR